MLDLDQKISLLTQLFILQKNDVSAYEEPIMKTLDEIFQSIITDYNTYRANAAALLDSLDCEGDESLAYTIKILMDLLHYVSSKDSYKEFDESVVNDDLPDNITQIYFEVLRKNLEITNKPRLSSFLTEFLPHDQESLRGLLNLNINQMQHWADIVVWDSEKIDSAYLNIVFGRGIAKKQDQLEIFYMGIGIFLERLITSGQAQLARNVCEECLLASYNDGVPEYGYYLSFKAYSVMANLHATLMYGNLCMICLVGKNDINIKLIKQLQITALKFFRNINFQGIVDDMHTEMSNASFWNDYERRTNDHTYFTSMLKRMDPDLPQKLLQFLEKEKDHILTSEMESTPWLVLLHNIKRLYPDIDFSNHGLYFYFNAMTEVVPAANIESIVEIINGDAVKLKNQLKIQLLKLQHTNNKSDFVFDNEMAIKISNRLLPNGDVEDFLIAMIVKSDYSLVFQNRKLEDVVEVKVQDIHADQFYENIQNPINQLEKFKKIEDTEIL